MATTRRLAAIMFTDMVGSTALGQANEAEALRLRDEQEELVRPLFVRHFGREVKSMGDGFLVAFESALHAVECAMDVQEHLHERNKRTDRRSIQLRIGIHLGDVEVRGTDILGDSVNVASRIQPLAEPGGVCISGQVYDQVRNKAPIRCVRLEAVSLKDVSVPIEVYRVTMPWSGGGADEGKRLDRHRVAVMPLVNMISGHEDEYFADGMTEELISAVSKVHGLSVISRTSVMHYKNQEKTASEIGKELHTGTLLEGSVRKAGGRVRIAVQLINAETDEHLWAENYDRKLEDVFSIQSEIAQSVATVLKATLLEGDRKRLERALTKDPEAHAFYLRGRAAHKEETEDGYLRAAELYQRAVEKDPQYAMAYAWLAIAQLGLGIFEFSPALEAAKTGEESARHALSLDPSLSEAHAALAAALYLRWDFDGAEAEASRALELDANSREALEYTSFLRRLRGRFGESEKFARRALEIDPLSPETIEGVATDLLYLGRPDEAIALYKTVLEIDPGAKMAVGNIGLAYVQKGRFDEGIASIREAMRLAKNPSVGQVADLAYALGKAGRLTELRELLAETLEGREKEPRNATALAAIYANLGDSDRAFEWLEKAIEEHSGYLPTVVFDFAFERLWSDPRMNAIRDHLGLRRWAPGPESAASKK